MASDGPVRVAVIGGGCASVTAAFELTRPEHRGKYQVTVYQQGWRLGGKGASGRGPAGRIEEHGLHVWLGFYENAFRLLRECYEELGRDPATHPMAGWRDAFFPDSHVGIAAPRPGRSDGGERDWQHWTAFFPPADGLPGDPLAGANPFTLKSYLVHVAALLRTLLVGLRTQRASPGDDREAAPAGEADAPSSGQVESFVSQVAAWFRFGALTAAAGLTEAAALVEVVVKALPLYPQNLALRWLESIAGIARAQLEGVLCADENTRVKWEIIDLVLAILVGAVRFRLLLEPRGLEAIDDYECRDWLRLNGASERSLDSPFIRSLYDLALAYEDGDAGRPGLAAGQALRGSLRMFFTYRGAMFWKMRAGMGDVVFAPFYEVLKRRGVRFAFFHRLENVALPPQESLAPGERPYVQALEFEVQARVEGGGEYRPLVDVKGLPCWPALPDYDQLVDGARLRQEGRQFESPAERRDVTGLRLEVGRDFDFVVLGVSVGVIPQVCREILSRDERWRTMVEKVKTVATQAFQLWLREDMRQLGWHAPAVTLSGFTKPFDTWSDMSHLVDAEDWGAAPPKAVAYFCGVLPDASVPAAHDAANSSAQDAQEALRREQVFGHAVRFLDTQVAGLWPRAAGPDGFRWELLADAAGEAEGVRDARALRSQYWAANVNPSDRYVLALPGSLRHRISPLDNSYDNLTICGDWTDCGFNEGCVEAAVISGRLAAHAIAHWPRLADIIGYDHP